MYAKLSPTLCLLFFAMLMSIRIAGAVNVRDKGAVGDGVNDDTVAVQAAFNEAIAGATGGVVYFPTGRYKITQPIECRYDFLKGLTIRGDGPRQSSICFSGMGTLFDVRAAGTAHSGFVDGFIIEGLGLHGPGINRNDSIALSLSRFEARFRISDCRFENWGGWAIFLGKFAMEGAILDCAFNTCHRGIFAGGYNDGVCLERSSFWGISEEALHIASSRVRVHRTFFGKSNISILFVPGELQTGCQAIVRDCDFEGQRDMDAFIQVGLPSDTEERIYRSIGIYSCRFGVNPRPASEGLAGEDMIAGGTSTNCEVPFAIKLVRPVVNFRIENGEFLNIKSAVVGGVLNARQLALCKFNHYNGNLIENVRDANASHFMDASYKAAFERLEPNTTYP